MNENEWNAIVEWLGLLFYYISVARWCFYFICIIMKLIFSVLLSLSLSFPFIPSFWLKRRKEFKWILSDISQALRIFRSNNFYNMKKFFIFLFSSIPSRSSCVFDLMEMMDIFIKLNYVEILHSHERVSVTLYFLWTIKIASYLLLCSS
jgi:hypothetical protein